MNSNKTQILRSLIKEMSFGGLVGPVIDPESEEKSLAGYYRSKLFAKKAESFFRDASWPYPVYVLPYIGRPTKKYPGVFGGSHYRTLFQDMDEGLKIAERLGFDISKVKDRSGFVICPSVGRARGGVQGFSLWVMFHAMFEGNWGAFDKLITSTDRLHRAGTLAYMIWEEAEDGSLVNGTFTMGSARDSYIEEQDVFGEAMTQELLQRHLGGFKPLDHVRALDGAPARALTDKERALLEEFASCIKICAAEFVESCRGKVCFPAV